MARTAAAAAPTAATDEFATLMATCARSFWAAARLFPRHVRSDVIVLYALCRTIDDAVDEAPDAATARATLARLHAELTGDAPVSPLVSAYRAVAERHEIPLECALTLLDGVRSDLGPVRISDTDELVRYCYRVASTVGLMMSRVVGCRDPFASPFAVDLGVAMQLTNIVRDVADDARHDRVYLPLDLMAEHGLSASAIGDRSADREALRALTERVLALAERYYESAELGMRFIPFRSRLGVLVASRLYAAIGRRVSRTRHDPLAGRMIVPRWEKTLRIAQGIVASMRSGRPGAERLPAHDVSLHHAIAGWPGADQRA